MADPMKIRANAVGDSTEVKVLMNHEMETGQRKDAQGKAIPAWFIQNVTATYNGKTVLDAQWGPAVSKNPFLEIIIEARHGLFRPSRTVLIMQMNDSGKK